LTRPVHRDSIGFWFAVWVAVSALIVFWYVNGNINHITFTSVIGPWIAIGPPALYAIYELIVSQPEVVIEDVKFRIQPMKLGGYTYKPPNTDDIEITIPHLARIAVFMIADVANTGNATAKNCKFEIHTNDEIFGARWDMVDNPVKYDLLPGEHQSIHIFKLFLTTDFFFLKENWYDDLPGVLKPAIQQHPGNPRRDQVLIENRIGNSEVQMDGNPNGTINIQTRRDLLNNSNINPKLLFPSDQPPERREKSIRGGWWGEYASPGGRSIQLKALSEGYKSCFSYLDNHDLPYELVVRILRKEDSILWVDEWNEYPEFKNSLYGSLAMWYNNILKK
jgi:hypothetical protein